MILGITGGTGCGKTTLLQAVAERGGLALDCDAIYHRLLQTDPALLKAIGTRFPGTVTGGALDRKALGARVFADPQGLLDLNGVTHGAVKAEVLRLLTPRPALAAIDAIALFEGGLGELCDVTVAVCAPEEVRATRLMAREGISRDYALARIRAQARDAQFVQRCDYCLENDGTLEDFRKKCLAFIDHILKKETVS